MKKAFQLKLVYQAIDRQTICKNVFVAIARPVKASKYKAVSEYAKITETFGNRTFNSGNR